MNTVKNMNGREQVEYIFRELMPKHGMAVREEQVRLCLSALDTHLHHDITLFDAGTGIGKTYSYLVAGLLARQRDPLRRPVLVSTSSVALQSAILQAYVPFLSEILLEASLIDRPLSAVIRKGKAHYVCDRRLERRLAVLRASGKREQKAEMLAQLRTELDLDKVKLSGFDRMQVQVEHCAGCPENCRYREFIRKSKTTGHDIQICNHNLLIADALHRDGKLPALLPDYGMLVIDEAHKLPEAMRQLFGVTLTGNRISLLLHELREQGFLLARDRLGRALFALEESWTAACRADMQSVPFPNTSRQAGLLQNVLFEAETILHTLRAELRPETLRTLSAMRTSLAVFAHPRSPYIRCLARDANGEPYLMAAARNCGPRIKRILWDRCESAVLTSGTLAAAGDFSRFRDEIGLQGESRVRTDSFLSPFDYKSNCLLYLPKNAPAPSAGSEKLYFHSMAEKIGGIIRASRGHSLVLFTSYSMLSEVYERLADMELPYPLFPVRNNPDRVIQLFKKSRNGVLLGTGALWEGIDFPGELVTSLIIPRLPFAVPGAESDAQKSRYLTLRDFIDRAVVPDMQVKLRQGFGRAFRTEQDYCAVSILDARALPGARYHHAAIAALPKCEITDRIEDIERFIAGKRTWERKINDPNTKRITVCRFPADIKKAVRTGLAERSRI